MRRVTTTAAGAVATLLVVLGATTTTGAQGPNPSERTFITFSGPVELPGLRLEPGTYVMKLADTPDRDIVQVLTRDERRVLGHWSYVMADRRDLSDETVLMFRETAAGTTPAVQFWYYPGEQFGKEFIYPRDQALQIAARTGAAVLTAEGRVTAQPEVGAQAEVEIAEAPEAATVPEEITAGVIDQPVLEQERPVGTTGVEEPRLEPEATTARAELPRTASPLVLTGLLGLLSLAAAAGFRAFRR